MKFQLIHLGKVIKEIEMTFDDEDAKALALKEALHDPLQPGELYGTWVNVVGGE